MKTLRLLYPDFAAGGLETYYLGAALLDVIVPPTPDARTVRVAIEPPAGDHYRVTDGIYAADVVVDGMREARRLLEEATPERVLTLGGNCIVSAAPFDYLHRRYPRAGILWLDAHPDVSLPENGYPNAHAMVLGSLLGRGPETLTAELSAPFAPGDLLYVGLQPVLDYQKHFLEKAGVRYKTDGSVSEAEILDFIAQHEVIFIHLDVDVLDERYFSDTYFANPALTGDGSGGGRMRLGELARILQLADQAGVIAALSVAEYLPFSAEGLRNALSGLSLFGK